MRSVSSLVALVLYSTFATASPVPQSNGCNKLGIQAVMDNWKKIWDGDRSTSLIQSTLMPNIVLSADRQPSGTNYDKLSTMTINVGNTAQLINYIDQSKIGFSKWGINNEFTFADSTGTKLAMKWTLDGTVGSDNPSKVKKSGDRISMSGIDIVQFDSCSGRIQRVYSAQNILDYANQFGMTIKA